MSGNLVERLILHRLAETTGRALDLAYTSLVHQMGLTQRFFPQGFGNLEVVNFHEDLALLSTTWPPEHFRDIKVEWKRIRDGKYQGAAYDVFKARFPTPVTGSSYDFIPEESRVAHALWILPRSPAPGRPTAIHLAATGDHGYSRREHLGLPLVSQGIGTIALESPYYGQRRPAGQQGAKLRYVSDLLLLGRATIEESLFLLQWLLNEGHERLGVAGLSMGGVHATMVASLFPGPVALAPMLTPRSAAVAYCGGALFHATAWDTLLADSRKRQQEILRVVDEAARAGQHLAEARINIGEEGGRDAAKSSAKLSSQLANQLADFSTQNLCNSDNDAARDRKQQGRIILPGSSASPISFGEIPLSSRAAAAVTSEEERGSPTPEKDSIYNNRAAGADGLPALRSWLSGWSRGLEGQIRNVRRLVKNDDHKTAVEVLNWVLETFTDVTRFPRPQRPDAAVLVAATEDAYVSRESVLEIHNHLPGSEVRWVPGGHVSSFLLHHSEFRKAVSDSLNRL